MKLIPCSSYPTSAEILLKGCLDVLVRTASKYDDCRLLHLPNLKIVAKMEWVCLSDPNDHHVVSPCNPERRTEYSSNPEHDSYRAFRSQNLNLSLSMETKPVQGDLPSALFFASTFRWFENLKFIFVSGEISFFLV